MIGFQEVTGETQKNEMPPLFQAEWDQTQIEQFFDDLARGADIQHVQVRTPSGDQKTSLPQAHVLWKSGQARMIQIRYRFEQQSWCDTLTVLPDCTRVIRTAID